VDVDVEHGAVTLLEAGYVAQLVVSVACRFGRHRAPGERVARLHSAKAVGHKNSDRTDGGGKLVVKGGKLGLVRVALKGVGEDVELPSHDSAP
jgi:hypothetical protein